MGHIDTYWYVSYLERSTLSRRIWRYQRSNQNPQQNKMAKRKRTKWQTTIYKTYNKTKDRL